MLYYIYKNEFRGRFKYYMLYSIDNQNCIYINFKLRYNHKTISYYEIYRNDMQKEIIEY